MAFDGRSLLADGLTLDHIRREVVQKVVGGQLQWPSMVIKVVVAAVDEYRAYIVSLHDPYRGARLQQANLDRPYNGLRLIAYTLNHYIENASVTVLQTSTIDLETYFAGGIVADQPSLAAGQVRRMDVTLNFAGEPHRFSLLLVPGHAHLRSRAARDLALRHGWIGQDAADLALSLMGQPLRVQAVGCPLIGSKGVAHK